MSLDRARVASGALLGAAYLAATFFLPPGGVLAVVLLIAAAGLAEFYALLDAARIPNFKILGTLLGCAWVFTTWYKLHVRGPAVSPDGDLLTLFLAFFAVFVRQFHQRHNPRPLETMAGTLMGLVYIGFALTFFVRLAMAWGDLRGRWLLLFLVVVVKFTDMGAYFVGCACGRHKLIPRISPAKSWEGCAGGVAIGVLAGLGLAWAFDGDLEAVRLGWGHALVLAALLAVVGILGDLAESMLKRAAGVKDSGATIAGMGGVLDVIDSLLPAAPVAYFYARAFLTP